MAASPLDNMRGLEYYLHDIMHAGNDVQEQQGKGEFSIFYKCVPPLFLSSYWSLGNCTSWSDCEFMLLYIVSKRRKKK